MAQEYIQKRRREYSGEKLDEATVDRDPFNQFEKWLDEAVKAELPDPHAMVVATVSLSRKPSARVVLLRKMDRDGFVFYTNYRSRKGAEIRKNPNAAALFYWHGLDRQVRIEGTVEKVSPDESDKYFHSRPRESQIAAWASSQSEVILSRAELDRLYEEYERKFAGHPIVRPDNWGGFRIKPESYEFWQGRPRRLHDRILYTHNGSGDWEIRRLAP